MKTVYTIPSVALASFLPVAKALATKNSTPALNCVLVDASEHGNLRFSATNMDQSATLETDEYALEITPVCIPFALLEAISKATRSGDPITVVICEHRFASAGGPDTVTHSVTLRNPEGSQFTGGAFLAAEFALFSCDQSALLYSGDAPYLYSALKSVSPAMSRDEKRYILNGVYMDITKGALVATDGLRLHFRPFKFTTSNLDKGTEGKILPEAGIALFEKAEKQAKGQTVSLCLSKDGQRISLSFGAFQLITKVIGGTYPNYFQVLPRETGPKGFTLHKADARTLSLILKQHVPNKGRTGRPCVKLSFDSAGGASLRSIQGNFASTGLPAKGILGALTIGFNPVFFFEAVEACFVHGDTAFVSFVDDCNPLQAVDARGFRSVVMPVRLE
jgi:DNA polymerase III sliding clamp (beta) subunit (PCNA family)